MKKKILAISTILTFLACQKVEVEFFHNTAMINGEEWSWLKQRSLYFDSPNKDNISVKVARHNQRNEEREVLIFNNIKEDLIGDIDTVYLESLKSGSSRNHPDRPTAYFYLSGSDGDVTIGSYELLNSEVFPSWLILERVNNKVIKGQFQGLFVNAYENLGAEYYLPDTLYVTEGAFLARKIR